MLYTYISNVKFDYCVHEMITQNKDLYYSYISNEGNLDLQNIFQKMYEANNIYIWKWSITYSININIIFS